MLANFPLSTSLFQIILEIEEKIMTKHDKGKAIIIWRALNSKETVEKKLSIDKKTKSYI